MMERDETKHKHLLIRPQHSKGNDKSFPPEPLQVSPFIGLHELTNAQMRTRHALILINKRARNLGTLILQECRNGNGIAVIVANWR